MLRKVKMLEYDNKEYTKHRLEAFIAWSNGDGADVFKELLEEEFKTGSRTLRLMPEDHELDSINTNFARGRLDAIEWVLNLAEDVKEKCNIK